MFENDLVELGAAGTLAAAEANEHTLTTAEVRRLQLAAHWADLHAGEAVPQTRPRGMEHPVRLGGDSTPTVGDFSPAELGGVLGVSDGSVSRLIADVLDLRHRLPRIWAAILAGQAPAYQARQLAAATRHLTCVQAGLVDARIAASLGMVSYGRLQTLLEAAIFEADPEGAGRRAAEVAKERFVRLGRASEYGLKLIIARRPPGMRSGSKPPSTGSPTSWAGGATPTLSTSEGRKRSGSWPSLPKRCGCCVTTKTMRTRTAPATMICSRSQPKTRPTMLITLPSPRRIPTPSTNCPHQRQRSGSR